MPLTINHAFVSAVPDEGNPGEIEPSHWNAAHAITGSLDAAAPANSVQYNNGGTFAGDGAFTYAGSGNVTVGQAAVGTGKINLDGTTSGAVTLSTQDAAGTWTMKLPTSGGSNNYVLATDGVGNTTWVPPTTGSGLPAGATNSVQYNAGAGSFGGAAYFFINGGRPQTTSPSGGYLYDGSYAILAQPSAGNWFLGGAGNTTLTGAYNTALGGAALGSLTTGNNNSAEGLSALQNCTTGQYNVGLGPSSLLNCTSGYSNFGMGLQALQALIDGANNVAIGFQSLSSTLHDGTNVAIGAFSLFDLVGGDHNIAIGNSSGQHLNASSFNTIIGANAGAVSTITGAGNTIIGSLAEQQLTSGGQCLVIGYNAQVPSPTANFQMSIANIIYGTNIDGSLTTVSSGNIGIGIKAPAVKLDVAGSVKTATSTVAGLPAAGHAGARNFVTDASAPTFGSAVVGGGAVLIPVYDDGVTWRVG